MMNRLNATEAYTSDGTKYAWNGSMPEGVNELVAPFSNMIVQEENRIRWASKFESTELKQDVKPKDVKFPDFTNMTKKELDVFAKENFNIELDRRANKAAMIKDFEDKINGIHNT